MKITEVKLLVLEDPSRKGSGGHSIARVEGLRRTQYTHKGRPRPGIAPGAAELFGSPHRRGNRRAQRHVDDSLSGRHRALSRSGTEPVGARGVVSAVLERHPVGVPAPGWFGAFDNCLWEILGKAADLPVYALVGRVRPRLPAYLTGGDTDIEGYLSAIETGKEMGIGAYKFHTYKGGKADIPIYRARARRRGTGLRFDHRSRVFL